MITIALIILLVVIKYKARQGIIAEGLIRGTKIFGYIYLIFSIVVEIIAIFILPDQLIKCIINLAINIFLLVIVARIRKTAIKIVQEEDN